MRDLLRRQLARLDASLRRDLIHRTATTVALIRTAILLAGWVLFATSAFPVLRRHFGPGIWLLHAAFAFGLALNARFLTAYWARRIHPRTVLLDMGVHLGLVFLVGLPTGGLRSPATTVGLLLIASYGFIYSPQAGTLAVILAVGGASVFVLVGYLLEPTALPDAIFGLNEPIGVALLELGILISVAASATWLFRLAAESERQLKVEAARSRHAADREHAAASVTSALLSVSEAVSRLTALPEVLDKVVEIAPRVLAVDHCIVFLWDEEKEMYRGAAVSGLSAEAMDRLLALRMPPVDVPDLEWVRRLGHCAVISPKDSDRLGVDRSLTILTAPLLTRGRFHGVILFNRRGRAGERSFTQSDLRLADGIAGQAAVAIERARLLEQSHRLARAMEGTQEAVLITDDRRRIRFVNPSFLKTFGYEREEVLGRDAFEVSGVARNLWEEEVQPALSARNWSGETWARRRNGERFPVEAHVSLILTEEGQLDGALVILQDSTATRQLQEHLARADRLAAAGQLAAGVAHEVNNALTGILGQTELAREERDPTALGEALSRVEVQAHRIGEILRDLLGFARPKDPTRRPVDLGAMVRDTVSLLGRDLERQGILPRLETPRDLPAVPADEAQIRQVLVNLITNAAQALQGRAAPSLTIRLNSRRGWVRLAVADNGPGISPEDLPRIFDPFFTTKESGSGLGLSVSYAIVAAHGGRLSARSRAGDGTVFLLELPCPAATLPSLHTVLLVDDDDAVAESLQGILARAGLEVERVATGQAAMARLQHGEFDAIFLDVRLPDIKGPEIHEWLVRHRPRLAERVAFVTGGLWRTENQPLRSRLPAQPTLGKPFTAEEVRHILELLRERRAA